MGILKEGGYSLLELVWAGYSSGEVRSLYDVEAMMSKAHSRLCMANRAAIAQEGRTDVTALRGNPSLRHLLKLNQSVRSRLLGAAQTVRSGAYLLQKADEKARV